jgi:GT2 family glycosyltransferase
MDLSVVIVNTNTRDLLLACLTSLLPELNGVEAEVFVVDNASDDGSLAAVQAAFPEVVTIANEANLGFARANNVAFRRVTGEDVMILNPDAEVRPGAIRILRQALHRLPNAVGVGPKVVRPDGRLDLACRRSFPSPAVAFNRLIGLSKLFPGSRRVARYNLTYMDPDRPGEMDCGTGAAMVFRREALAAVDFFDERFFMYADDLDLCYRLKQRGGRIYYVPEALVMHVKGGTSRQRPRAMLREFHRSMWLFYRKHYAHGWAIGLAPAVWLGIKLRHALILGVNAVRGRQIVSP